MNIPDYIVYTFGIVSAFYLFASIRDKRQEKKTTAELHWLRLKAEYMEGPEKFAERPKNEMLLNHKFLQKIYQDRTREDVLNDLREKSFVTTQAYSSFMREQYGD